LCVEAAGVLEVQAEHVRLGIPLDGTNNTTPVADTDGGVYDGDPAVDHAVGPMQFIPGTWRAYARDANSDGKADPENMYDATLAAADYLCKSAPLTDDAGLSRGYYRYNHSDSYVRNVLAWAHRYAATTIPPPPPADV
jgi:membrane-bound lytic murein transglycosylase B